MGTQQITAPSCAQPVASGVIHSNVRHTSGFTVIGNHLAQHRGLSLVAVGLAVHIQSLPAGAKVGIKRLAGRFPESETRIAAALRELEAAGYLHRSRVRLADGRIVTRTVSSNQPGADTATVTAPPPRPTRGTDRPAPPPSRECAPPPPPQQSTPLPVPEPAAVLVPAPTARTAPPPPLPQPQALTPELQRAATAILADLRRHAPQLVLSVQDIELLAPSVATWLERDASPEAVRHALSHDLPVPLKHPAKLLRHRITTLLPPPLPGMGELEAARPHVIVIPLQNCDRCDRAFRSRHAGHCRDCRTDLPTAA